jgi:hypothetical protein
MGLNSEFRNRKDCLNLAHKIKLKEKCRAIETDNINHPVKGLQFMFET